MRDAIVVGGGIAGMSAAWRLRFGDVLVLEGSNRIGGRLRSERRGPERLLFRLLSVINNYSKIRSIRRSVVRSSVFPGCR